MCFKCKKHLRGPYQITGHVKPGAQTCNIVETAKSDIRRLTKKDVVVVIGGANDVFKNSASQGIRNLTKFAKESGHTNVVFLSVPHRHDLVEWSCVNNEIKNFNSKLRKRMELFENTRVFDMDPERSYYTRHGLHMNSYGKDLLAKKLAEEVRRIFLRSQKTEPIVLPWIEDNTQKKEEEMGTEDKSTQKKEGDRGKEDPRRDDEAKQKIEEDQSCDKEVVRRSERTKKPPQKDFLYQSHTRTSKQNLIE